MAEDLPDSGAHSIANSDYGFTQPPKNKGKDRAADEVADTHDCADPAQDIGRANITAVDQGAGVAEKDKKF